ncbi:MAG: hypothetical protein AAGF23_20880, partial [Acidobacteriota bacterium]
MHLDSTLLRRALFAFILIATSSLSPGAYAQAAWTIETDSSSNTLVQVDLEFFAKTPVGPIGLSTINGMTRGPGGDLYLVAPSLDGFFARSLYRLDANSLDLEEIGDLGLPDPPAVSALTVLPDGRLLMSGDAGGLELLYQIDPGTGRATVIGETSKRLWSLVATPDRVYAGAVDSTGSYGLYEVDPATADVLFLFSLPDRILAGRNAMDAGFDGLLYHWSTIVVGSPPFRVEDAAVIDPATGD